MPQRYNDDLEIEDAIHTALLTLREGFEGEVRPSRRGLYCHVKDGRRLKCIYCVDVQMNEDNIEVGIIKDDKKFHVLTPAEVKDYLEQAE